MLSFYRFIQKFTPNLLVQRLLIVAEPGPQLPRDRARQPPGRGKVQVQGGLQNIADQKHKDQAQTCR